MDKDTNEKLFPMQQFVNENKFEKVYGFKPWGKHKFKKFNSRENHRGFFFQIHFLIAIYSH